MPLFFTKSELNTYVGFDDRPAVLIGIFPLAVLGNVLFGGSQPGLDVWENFACYGISLIFTVLYWVICRYVVIRFRMWFPEREQTLRRILIMLPVLVVTIVFISTTAKPLIFLTGADKFLKPPSLIYESVMAFTLVMMVVAIYEGVYFFIKYRASQLEQERLAKQNMQAQLSVLKQQMNPHFLFNSLNTLVNIIPEDSEKATLFTQRLAAVYRRILEYRHKETIPIEEELVALQDYIFLLQTRFEEKLQVEWHLSARARVQCEEPMKNPGTPPHLRFHRIVPLSVQLLVENAVKHNVISNDRPLRIDITLDDDAVIVTNGLQLRERRLKSTGWGHENLQRRYAAITDRSFRIEQTEDTYSVHLPIFPPELATRAITA